MHRRTLYILYIPLVKGESGRESERDGREREGERERNGNMNSDEKRGGRKKKKKGKRAKL